MGWLIVLGFLFFVIKGMFLSEMWNSLKLKTSGTLGATTPVVVCVRCELDLGRA